MAGNDENGRVAQKIGQTHVYLEEVFDSLELGFL
jgi:hypothetical protein